MIREPLDREEVINSIERKGCNRIPLVMHKWWGEGLLEKYGKKLQEMAEDFPEDVVVGWYQRPGDHKSSNNNPEYRWGYRDEYRNFEAHSIAERKILLPDWNDLDKLLDKFPDPEEPGNFKKVEKIYNSCDERYRLGAWWTLYHEAFWNIRGMENLMFDYYDHMDNLKILGKALLEYYKVIVDRYADFEFDGIFVSDDLGHQNGPMMSPAVFEELYFPLYKEFISYVHDKGMHVFLHSCGDNTLLMKYLIEAGLDVLHPIQKGCMNENEIIEKFGNKISFLYGIDIQHLLPKGSPEEIRSEIKSIIELFHKPEGGLLLAAGNGIMPDTPLENIRVMLEEISKY